MRKVKLPWENKTKEIDIDRGLVIVGANGTGKTRLGSWIDESEIRHIVHRISAQRSLSMPANIHSVEKDKSEQELLFGHPNIQHKDNKKANRWRNNPATLLLNDFDKLLVYLFSENNEVSNKYRNEARLSNERLEPPVSKIDAVKKIWEEILPHRELVIHSTSIKTRVKGDEKSEYDASEMSDGERVIFYLIGQCLAAPKDGVFIVDEPGLHLHKSIQYALWDKIESAREDCLFIYLTHDVEFAASRIGFTTIWLKKYDGKEWEWTEINDSSVVPEELLFEIYGSRKKTLLIEGSDSSYDVKLYRKIFVDFFVKPCGSCENVISYTKALKESKEFHQREVFGLIDRDSRTDVEVTNLEASGIFCLKVAEVENLFAIPGVLEVVASNLQYNFNNVMESVRRFIFSELKKELDVQVSLKTSQEIKHQLFTYNLTGKSLDEIKSKVDSLLNRLKIDDIYQSVKVKYEEIISDNDYEAILRFYNRKTIASQIGGIFGLKNDELPNFIIRLCQDEKKCQAIIDAIKKYLPPSFVTMINVLKRDNKN